MSDARECQMELVTINATRKPKLGVRVVINLLWKEMSSAPNADQICNWISQFPIPTLTTMTSSESSTMQPMDKVIQSKPQVPTPTLTPTNLQSLQAINQMFSPSKNETLKDPLVKLLMLQLPASQT